MTNKYKDMLTAVKTAFSEIDNRVKENLKNGGDGCNDRIVNESFNEIDDILGNTPMRIDGVLYGN